jgi:hypothetical protein
MWAELMDELREIHLGLKPKPRTSPSVGERLQAPMGRWQKGQRLTSARRSLRWPDERRGTSSPAHAQSRQLSPSQQSYRAAVTRNDFLTPRSGPDSASAIGRR